MLTFKKSPSRLAAVAAITVASAFGMSVHATDITGAGSSFVYPVLTKWSAAYAEKTGNHLNYQSVGSGAGIAQIKAGTIDFGASDAPLSSADLQKYGLGQFPLVEGHAGHSGRPFLEVLPGLPVREPVDETSSMGWQHILSPSIVYSYCQSR